MPKLKAHIKTRDWIFISRNKKTGVIRKQVVRQPEGWAPPRFVKVSQQDYLAAAIRSGAVSALGVVDSENRKWLELLDTSRLYLQTGLDMAYYLEPHSAERIRRLLGPYAGVMKKMWGTE